MNNVISYVAPKKWHTAWALKIIISYVFGISIFGFDKYWQKLFEMMELKISPKFKKVLIAETINYEKKILPMIWYKYNESLPQAKHNKTTNIREHPCQTNWDGLHSQNTLWKESHQHGWRKITHQDQSTRKAQGRKAVPVWLHKALMDYLQGFPFGGCYVEGQNIGLENEIISRWGKEDTRRISSGGRWILSGGRCGKIEPRGGISSGESGIKYVSWDG